MLDTRLFEATIYNSRMDELFAAVHKEVLVPAVRTVIAAAQISLLLRPIHRDIPPSMRLTYCSLRQSDGATTAVCNIRLLHLTWMQFQATFECVFFGRVYLLDSNTFSC